MFLELVSIIIIWMAMEALGLYDNSASIVALYFQLTAPGKDLVHAQNTKSDSNQIKCMLYMHA